MSKIQTIIDTVKELSVIELSELVKTFEEEFGVSAAAPVAASFVLMARLLLCSSC